MIGIKQCEQVINWFSKHGYIVFSAGQWRLTGTGLQVLNDVRAEAPQNASLRVKSNTEDINNEALLGSAGFASSAVSVSADKQTTFS